MAHILKTTNLNVFAKPYFEVLIVLIVEQKCVSAKIIPLHRNRVNFSAFRIYGKKFWMVEREPSSCGYGRRLVFSTVNWMDIFSHIFVVKIVL